MEATFVGAVVGATIQVVLQNLLRISQEQISLVRDFKKDLEKLKKSFLMVCDFLYDAEMRQVTDRAVKRWLRDLEALAFDADNVLDEINYQLVSKKVEAGNKIKKKVQSFFSNSKLAGKVRDINKRLEISNQEAIGFGLHMRHAGARAPVSGSDASSSIETTDSFSVDPIILGRENDVSRIVEMLTTTTPAEQTLISVLPIVGMGGLGKTTLARLVFGHAKIKTHFGDNRVWVHVPKTFDVRNILKNILTSLTEENVELGTREGLLKKLQKKLGAKRYLLVLDDIWNEEREKWDSFVNSLSGISSAMGNCMIVTTRSQEVASIVRIILPIHVLKSLSEDNCWSIIKAKAFIESGDIPIEFETVGRNIAERCRGLPLAAKVVGGLLCNKSKDEWLSIEKNWLSNVGDGYNTISKILKLSFDNLSSPSLKKCFAYCSIFPKGYRIEKEELVELCMAEGFLQTDQRSEMETIGNNFFYLLLKNSLLQVTEKENYGNVTHCNMHDLVHDLACSVLGENDNVTYDICRSRYIGYKSSGHESLSIPKEQARCVRTLFFNGRVSDITFSDFKSLHTLTLVGTDSDKLPTSIRELIHLRYLDITRTIIRYLPDSVGELYHLQTLRAKRGYCELEKLPDSMKYLINLRHLHIHYKTALPCEIGRLTSLQTLPYFHVGHEKGRGVAELGRLKNLKGKLEIYNLGKVHDKDEAKSADLFRKTNINKLKLVWDESREGEANDESVLEGLQPHPNLKSLQICGFKGKSLPSWTWKMVVRDDLQGCWVGLNELTEIKLQNCSECEELPMLGHLPHLKSLYLYDLKNVRSIGSSFYNIDNCSSSNNNGVCKRDTIVVFQTLERLVLSNMPNLREWTEVEYLPPSEGDQTQLRKVVVFPCLKHLQVKGCRQLMSAPSKFPCLKELTISLPSLNIMCGMKLTSLRCLEIIEAADSSWNNVSSNETVDAILQASQLSLRRLSLEGLEHWECLPDQLQHLTCLSQLFLFDFGIEALPEWFGNLSSLSSLCLYSCKKLRHLPSKQAMQRLTKLTDFEIYGCPLLLKKRCNNINDDDDSEWPKISHIPSIFVDGSQISSRHGH